MPYARDRERDAMLTAMAAEPIMTAGGGDAMPRTAKPIAVSDARAQVLRHTPVLPADTVALPGLLGRRLAAPVVATEAQPPANLAAMDGYAVRAADLAGAQAAAPVVLRLIGSSRAGGPEAPSPRAGEAVRIATGARVPAGADAVVMQEGCAFLDDQRIAIRTAARPGENVRQAGEEYRPGETLLAAGTEVTPAVIGLLASAGWVEAAVYRRPRVAILSVGDELQDPAQRRRDANGPMLRAACEAAGAEVVEMGVVGDQVAAAAAWLAAAGRRADVVLSSGSASVGDFDVVPAAWRAVGVDERFGAVALRPGKPCHFGVLHPRVLVFALPGNPLAALTGFEELVAPALLQMAGGTWQPDPRLRLPLAAPLDLQRSARYVMRLGPGDAVVPPERQGSAPLRMAANSLRTGDWDGPCHRPAGWPVEVRTSAAGLRGGRFRPVAPLPAVIGVRGYSGSGKTRLLEQLIPALRRRGLQIGTIKHTHHEVAYDVAGKDTHRHAAAGACMVLAVGAREAVLQRLGEVEQDVGSWLEPFAGLVDLVLVEGFKETPLAHVAIEVGDGFDLSSGHQDGLRCWRIRRQEGDDLSYPDDLIAKLADLMIEELTA